MMQLRKATRKKAKLRIGISAASGFGKTYSSLLMAYGITGDWSKIAVIDTENGSADLYENLGEYNVVSLPAPYSPEVYIEAIQICENGGMEVIVIDSASHEWDGQGGILQLHEEEVQRMTYKNSYTAWAKVTPRHNAFIQAILGSSCHVIITSRRKQDYDMVKNEKGKTEVVKVGTKEIQRDGFEYELTLSFEILNDRHYAKASKDRTGLFDGRPEFVISEETGKELAAWANTGVDELEIACKEMQDCNGERECMAQIWRKWQKFHGNKHFVAAMQEQKEKLKEVATEELQNA